MKIKKKEESISKRKRGGVEEWRGGRGKERKREKQQGKILTIKVPVFFPSGACDRLPARSIAGCVLRCSRSSSLRKRYRISLTLPVSLLTLGYRLAVPQKSLYYGMEHTWVKDCAVYRVYSSHTVCEKSGGHFSSVSRKGQSMKERENQAL